MPGPASLEEQGITLPERVKGSDTKIDRNRDEVVITTLKAKHARRFDSGERGAG